MQQQKTDTWRGQLRIPMPLAEWARERGQKNFRSLNAEIVEILRRHKEQEDRQGATA